MQRVRIGLTGLGFVFVAVLLATALTGEPETGTPAAGNKAATGTAGDQPKEPFSELGYAPKNVAEPPANETKPAP